MIPMGDAGYDRRLEIAEDLGERLRRSWRPRRQRMDDLARTRARQHGKPFRVLEVVGDPLEDRAALRDQLVAGQITRHPDLPPSEDPECHGEADDRPHNQHSELWP